MKWRKRICGLGYRDDWKQLNSANFGAYTSRNRLFGIFAKPDEPIAWPEATHTKRPESNISSSPKIQTSLFPEYDQTHSLKKWLPVREVLDFADQGESIFHRKRPLSEATLERIFAGLMKFIAHGDNSFLSKYYSGTVRDKNISLNGAFVQTKSLDTNPPGYTIHNKASLEWSSPVIVNQDRLRSDLSQFLMHYY